MLLVVGTVWSIGIWTIKISRNVKTQARLDRPGVRRRYWMIKNFQFSNWTFCHHNFKLEITKCVEDNINSACICLLLKSRVQLSNGFEGMQHTMITSRDMVRESKSCYPLCLSANVGVTLPGTGNLEKSWFPNLEHQKRKAHSILSKMSIVCIKNVQNWIVCHGMFIWSWFSIEW